MEETTSMESERKKREVQSPSIPKSRIPKRTLIFEMNKF